MNEREESLVRRMITESGEMWRESRDRTKPNSQVVICQYPERAIYLHWIGNTEGNINGWGVQEQPLEMHDAQEFFAAFGSHSHLWIGAVMQGGAPPVRAYIKNGREPNWTISVGSNAA